MTAVAERINPYPLARYNHGELCGCRDCTKDRGPNHGTRTGYSNGCRCEQCTGAERSYKEAYRARRAANRKAREANLDWLEQAACRALDLDPVVRTAMFFPERGGMSTVVAARRVCLACPVWKDCLDYGLQEREGMWAGLTPRQRRELRRCHSRDRRIERAVEMRGQTLDANDLEAA